MGGESILLVDDEDSVRQFCRKILKESGYQVETVSGGGHALELLKQSPVDVLLTDLKMSDMDGLRLIQEARVGRPDLATVVMTGYGTTDTMLESLKMGVMGFMMKPFTPEILLASIQGVLEKKRILRENARLKLLMPFFEVTKTLMSEVDLNRLLNLIMSHAVQETRAEEGSLFLLDGEGQPRCCVITDSVPNKTGILKGHWGERITRWMLEHRQPFTHHRKSAPYFQQFVANGQASLKSILDETDLLSVLSVPLIKKDNIIGVLNLAKLLDPAPFTETDLNLITVLCSQAAVAIENARLFRELQLKNLDLEEVTYNGIRALALALETKDWQDCGAKNRLVEYATAIADKLYLSSEEVRRLKYAAVLHDIGLIGIRDTLLKKKGRFNEKDYREVQRHPLMSAHIIKRMGFLDDVVPVVYHHHERWDGRGYPEGLVGKEIPTGSRILAVVDSFDAMITDRPYRKAMPIPVAIAELEDCSGTQFDPEVVKAFLRILSLSSH